MLSQQAVIIFVKVLADLLLVGNENLTGILYSLVT